MHTAQVNSTTNNLISPDGDVAQLLSNALNGRKNRRLVGKILKLMKNVEGLSSLVETTAEQPSNQLVNILHSALSWPLETRHYWVIHQLSRLSVFHYQTVGDSEKWNPLYCSHEKFLLTNKSADTWHDELPHPIPDVVLTWLKS